MAALETRQRVHLQHGRADQGSNAGVAIVSANCYARGLITNNDLNNDNYPPSPSTGVVSPLVSAHLENPSESIRPHSNTCSPMVTHVKGPFSTSTRKFWLAGIWATGVVSLYRMTVR